MPRLPERLPAPLSERLASASQAIYSRLGREVDVAVGGIPFMLATSGDVPQSIETIQVRKDQFDAERDPGEQSLSGWWRRSQSSFHQGAGFLYEPNTDDPHNGFWDSENVEVFEQGELTLLPGVERLSESAVWSRLRPYVVSGTRTNLCTNPSLETDATGWTNNANCTIARVTTKSSVGSASLEVTSVGGSTWSVDAPEAAGLPSGAYSYSIRVWVPAGAPPLKIVSNFVAGAVSTVTDDWQTITFRVSGGVQLQVQPNTPPAAGVKYYLDAALIEEGNVNGSYFDGNSTGGAWTGTANNSTSTLTIGNGAKQWSGVTDGELNFDGPSGSTHAPAGKTIVDGLVSGTNFYDIASDGTLYQGSTSSPGTATSWPCGNATTRLGWGKHRLWVIGGRRLWQPDLSLAGGSAQNAKFTHPNLGWNYTCMAEGPAAMFFGGHDGNTSTIQAITLDTGGGLPTLTGASTSAALPDGELVQELAVVAGQFIGIGTTAGFRIGVMEGSNITYGPLMIEPEGVLGTTALISDGRFFLMAFETGDGLSQVYKVDTSVEVSSGVYAYAKDMQCQRHDVSDTPYAGTITSLAAVQEGLLAATSPGLWRELGDGTLCESGYVETSRIRFRTTEPKAYKYVDLDVEPLTGNISVEAVLEGGSTLPLGSMTQQGEIATDSMSWAGDPMRYASLRIEMTRDEEGTAGPTLYSYLIRALPAVAPQHLITLPLLCYDQEQARSGQRYGKDGYSNDRLTALILLERGAQTLVFQDFTTGLGIGMMVVIESLKFIQTTPRDSSNGNAGGILYLQLRTVDA